MVEVFLIDDRGAFSEAFSKAQRSVIIVILHSRLHRDDWQTQEEEDEVSVTIT